MRTKNDSFTLSGTDMTVNITSDPIWLGHIVNYSIQVVYTGTPNGTLKLQGSNDQGANDTSLSTATITNWTDIPSSSIAVSAAGSSLLLDKDCGYRWVRLVWTDSASGASSITVARYNVKGI